jgi:hypothetical protein
VVAEQQVLQDHLKPEVQEQQQIFQIHRKHFPEVAAVVQTKLEIQAEMVDPEAEAEAVTDKIHLQQEQQEQLTQAVAEEPEGFLQVPEQPVVVE